MCGSNVNSSGERVIPKENRKRNRSSKRWDRNVEKI